MVRFSFGELGEWVVLPGSLRPRIVVPIRVPSMGQIDWLENDSYLTELWAKKLHKKRRYAQWMQLTNF